MGARFNKNGNTKIGRIWSFSKLMGNEPVSVTYNGVTLTETGTCGGYCEGCKKACYVRHSYRYPSVKYGHMVNTMEIRWDIDSVRHDLHGYLTRARNKPEAVRIHVSGELESVAEFEMWERLAEAFPSVRFYIYSKAYDILTVAFARAERYGGMSENLTVNVSVWHEYGIQFYMENRHLSNVRAFVYDDGFDYGAHGLTADSTCPAYTADGKSVDGVTCQKCGLCMGKREKKVTFCPAHK